jgi:large subunit ribosomal protein L30e
MSFDKKKFEKDIKTIIKSGKFSLGLKEATKSLKGVKLLIYSNSLKDNEVEELKNQCRSSSVPTYAYPGSSFSLGLMCGKPFKVSVISVRSIIDTNLSLLGGK